MNEQEGTGCVSLSLPSLRVDAFTVGIASEIQKVRRTGLTFAPEGGTWRIRQVINKLITEEDLYAAVDGAYSQGWRRVKLYFLVGLPDRDGRRHARDRRAGARTSSRSAGSTRSMRAAPRRSAASCRSRTRRSSGSARTAADELQRKIGLLRDAVRKSGAQLRWHDPEATFAEGIASRGDRRIGRVIERVWRAGGTFQEWSEHFDLGRWLDAMAAEGLDPDWYVTSAGVQPEPSGRRKDRVAAHRMQVPRQQKAR